MKQLLGIRVRDLAGMKTGDRRKVDGSRGNRSDEIIMCEPLRRVWLNYLAEVNPGPDDYLFKSGKGYKPLTITSASRLVNNWFREAGIIGPRGARAIYKAWEFHIKTGTDFIQRLTEDKNIVSRKRLRPIGVLTMTVQETVYSKLFQAIVSGQIPPGSKLVIEEIARELGVSHIPVREAMGRLAAAGFISTQPIKGSVVNRFSREDLEEITEIRLVNESLIAQKAALRCRPQTIRRLEASLHQFVVAWDLTSMDDIAAANRRFHQIIYREAGMPHLQRLTNQLWDKISPYYHLLIHGLGDWESVKYHRKILEGMRNRDPEEVSVWLRCDINDGAQVIIKFLDRLKG